MPNGAVGSVSRIGWIVSSKMEPYHPPYPATRCNSALISRDEATTMGCCGAKLEGEELAAARRVAEEAKEAAAAQAAAAQAAAAQAAAAQAAAAQAAAAQAETRVAAEGRAAEHTHVITSIFAGDEA
eukprot:scaffold75078_cov30-Phaeocystis_antarctica.AAC.1